MNKIKQFWKFLQEDTWQSWIVSLVLLVVLIRFIIFPLLSFTTGSALPLVVVESCSMYHEGDFNDWWFKFSDQYDEFEITKSDFRTFPMHNGFSKGDIIFVWGRGDYNVGDIIIFQPDATSTAVHPIIHRVVTEDPIGTKGDNGITNPRQLDGNNIQRLDETSIRQDQIIGKSVFRIPAIGWIKLIFFELGRDPSQRGFC